MGGRPLPEEPLTAPATSLLGGGGLINDPLVNIGAGLLAASGPSLVPNNLGQGLLAGIQAAQRGQVQAARNAETRERLLQLQERRRAGSEVQTLINEMSGRLPTNQTALLSQMAALNPEAALRLANESIAPQRPGGLERDFNFLTGLGVPQDKALETLKRGPTVNVGDKKLDEPIPIPQIPNVRLPDGSSVDIGTTFRQAREAGATVQSTKEQETVQQTDSALAILDELESLGTGPGGVLANVEPGFLNRASAALTFAFDDLTQRDPKVSQFKGLRSGTVATIIRTLGERGSLSDGDVKRALNLLPSTGNIAFGQLPDSREVANQKMQRLRKIIEKGVRKFNQQSAGRRKFRVDPTTNRLIEVR